jgi:hypothetical protein
MMASVMRSAAGCNGPSVTVVSYHSIGIYLGIIVTTPCYSRQHSTTTAVLSYIGLYTAVAQAHASVLNFNTSCKKLQWEIPYIIEKLEIFSARTYSYYEYSRTAVRVRVRVEYESSTVLDSSTYEYEYDCTSTSTSTSEYEYESRVSTSTSIRSTSTTTLHSPLIRGRSIPSQFIGAKLNG